MSLILEKLKQTDLIELEPMLGFKESLIVLIKLGGRRGKVGGERRKRDEDEGEELEGKGEGGRRKDGGKGKRWGRGEKRKNYYLLFSYYIFSIIIRIIIILF